MANKNSLFLKQVIILFFSISTILNGTSSALPCEGILHKIQNNINPFSLIYQSKSTSELSATQQFIYILKSNEDSFDQAEKFWNWLSVNQKQFTSNHEAAFITDVFEQSVKPFKLMISKTDNLDELANSFASYSLSIANHTPPLSMKRSLGKLFSRPDHTDFYSSFMAPSVQNHAEYWVYKYRVHLLWLERISEALESKKIEFYKELLNEAKQSFIKLQNETNSFEVELNSPREKYYLESHKNYLKQKDQINFLIAQDFLTLAKFKAK